MQTRQLPAAGKGDIQWKKAERPLMKKTQAREKMLLTDTGISPQVDFKMKPSPLGTPLCPAKGPLGSLHFPDPFPITSH